MITYKKIAIGNRNELTEKLIAEMYIADTLMSTLFESFEKYAKYIREYGSLRNPIIYLIKNDSILLGAALGREIDKELFKLSLFIPPDYKKQGIGTKLLFHVVADIRANTRYESIDISPLEGTKEILYKLVSERKLKNNKLRECKTAKLKYALDIVPDTHTRINIQRYPKPKSLTKKISESIFRYVSKLKHKIKII